MRTAPAEFSSLGLDVDHFRLARRNEYHGPCPYCGGEDRFVIYTDRAYPSWNFWCRNGSCQLHAGGWIDQLNPRLKVPISPAMRQELEEKRHQQQAAAQAERLARLQEYTARELWTGYHQAMNEENRRWWRQQGIPVVWQNWWKLGYTPEKIFKEDDITYKRPAYTIPKFDLGWQPTNIDYRLVDPPEKVGKYRPSPGLAPAAFFTRPDLKEIPDQVWVCEGSKKAMVLALRQKVGTTTQMVFGVPSKNSWAGIDERVRQCGRVWVIFDPDGLDWAYCFAQSVGKNARVVQLPTKIDDAFNLYGMTPEAWQEAMRWARRV